jgi:hypothetical protein
LKENPNRQKALAVTEWTLGSRMIYYSLPYKNKVFVIDQRKDQFDFWQKDSPVGYDILFVQSHFSNEDIPKKFRCDGALAAKKIDIRLRGAKVDTIEYVWCRNFQGFKDENR